MTGIKGRSGRLTKKQVAQQKLEEWKKMTEAMNTAAGVVEANACRSCGGKLDLLSDILGYQHVSAFPRSAQTTEVPAPLILVRCVECSLVQLSHSVSRDRLYREYWYKSGLQPAMVDSLRELTTYALRFADLQSGDYVVDIGANDGTLLRLLANACGSIRLNKVAFDPAETIRDDLADSCDILIPDYFPAQRYDAPKAKIIFSIAMFYDLDDPRAFVREIKRCLRRDGVWVLQLGDLRAVLEDNAFDAVCHEHVCYYSLSVLKKLIEEEGLQVVDAQRNMVNGGSIRLAVIQPNAYVQGTAELREVLQREVGLDEKKVWLGWTENLVDIRDKIRHLILQEERAGGSVDVYGASTKGNTLLQYFGIKGMGYGIPGDVAVRNALERAEGKWGRYTVGSWIPIISEEQGRMNPATLLLVLPWHFRRAILARERQRGWPPGTKMLFPLPWPEEVTL